MNTINTTKPDVLRMTTIGKMGAVSGVKVVTAARLTVTKAFNEPTDSIFIDTVEGTFRKAQRETALINIAFADGEIWSGSFRELQKTINSAQQALKLIGDIESCLVEQLTEDYNENKDVTQIRQRSQDILEANGMKSLFTQ